MTNIFDEIVRPKAMEQLKRAVLPYDQMKAGNQKSIFLKELSSKNYQYDAEGKIVTLDSNGFEVRDKHGYNLSIDQVIKSEYDKYFETSDLPINEAECIARLKDEKITPAVRKKISDHWERLKTK
jgi:hypothetical protein